jgi:hypothetical protein
MTGYQYHFDKDRRTRPSISQACCLVAVMLWAFSGFVFHMQAQTASTGAIAGSIADITNSLVTGAKVTATSLVTGENRTVMSMARGNYLISALPPGLYQVEVTARGFKSITVPGVQVNVTSTTRVDVQLPIGTATETVVAQSQAVQLETESSALGKVTGEMSVTTLPLVTRNYTQILGLSSGVATDGTDASEIGHGGGSAEDPVVVNGSSQMDNNYQMNGVEINDLQNSGHFSGGVAIPNPDTIQEFKVQTGQYDATYGRNAGGNVDVVTKGGSNQFHGTAFEYFRNEDLNANDFFSKSNGQARGVLRQNQFGFTLGGPVRKDKLLFFTSYQGTRQRNGVAKTCSSNLSLPPLTNDRSRTALGELFQGEPTYLQEATGYPLGPTVSASGSNISDQALALMQYKLEDGSYLIPTPQKIDTSESFDAQGTASFHDPCSFDEDQFMTNADFLLSEKSKLAFRFFFANSDQTLSLPTSQLGSYGGGTAPGFPAVSDGGFRNFSLAHTYTVNPRLLNQFELAYNRQTMDLTQKTAFKFSDVGITAPTFDDEQPVIGIPGSLSLGGNGQGMGVVQNIYIAQDSVFYNRGINMIRVGGGITRGYDDMTKFNYYGGVVFGTFQDFLLGKSGKETGVPIGNVLGTVDLPGMFRRAWRVWDGNVYVQDDIKLAKHLTLNIGFRYERLGGLGDEMGRNAAFDPSKAVATAGSTGSLEGFVVSDNYKGTVPTGVTVADNNLGMCGDGQNTWNPRLGFVWQLPGTERVVLRSGYGIYHSRTSGQLTMQLLTTQPFAINRTLVGTSAVSASIAQPFPTTDPTLPSFTAYSSSTTLSLTTLAQNFQPPVIQRYSLNSQVKIPYGMLLEVGYVGSRSTHLVRARSVNQAEWASEANPIRGVTTNTVANVQSRVPIQGIAAASLGVYETEGAAWYNGMNIDLTKQYAHGLLFQASYTFAKNLSTDLKSTTQGAGGLAVGDQNNSKRRYGEDNFTRRHRFVANYVYDLPTPKNLSPLPGLLLKHWQTSGILTFQSGHHLYVTYTDAANAYGITNNFAEIVSGCGSYMTSGSLYSRVKSHYLNTSCFTKPPVIGSDGLARDFGNSGVGIITGPGQYNADFAVIRKFPLKWMTSGSAVEFRTEFFNAFNTPEFSDPDTSLSSSTFGEITTTANNPRILQFALKFGF